MYHPTTRVLAVLALLQAHGRMSGSQLAQRIEVNVRTLRRYIIMLQDLGIPIESERGRNGAYVLSAGFKLPLMMFTFVSESFGGSAFLSTYTDTCHFHTAVN